MALSTGVGRPKTTMSSATSLCLKVLLWHVAPLRPVVGKAPAADETSFRAAEANIVFDSEKPIVFMFDEIVTATENFDERQKLGQGAYGLVFYGNLRKQVSDVPS